MFKSTTLSDWEILVKKQLKTESVDDVLHIENIEHLKIQSFQDSKIFSTQNLPKSVESTHLVSTYREELEEEVFAFLLGENVENIADKSLFIQTKELAEHIIIEDDNEYFSLIDVFDVESGKLDEQLVKELLAKDFNKNICVDVSFIQNCGASIIQQLSMAIAKCKDLIEVSGVEILNKIIFKIAIGQNYLLEISKIRALKLLFNQLSKEYNLNFFPFIFAETSLRNKTISDAENNLIRATLELSSAMIGGADAVFSTNFIVDQGTELSQEISFKQQIVLAYESIVNVFDDAANGSFFIEDCTQQFARKSWEKFLEIENSGGFSLYYDALKEEIISHAKKEHALVESGKIKLVGANMYPKLESKKTIEDLYNWNKFGPIRWSEIYE